MEIYNSESGTESGAKSVATFIVAYAFQIIRVYLNIVEVPGDIHIVNHFACYWKN